MSLSITPLSKKSIKPLSLAVSSILVAACSSTPTVNTSSPVSRPTVVPASQGKSNVRSAQENAALLDMDSLDELEGLLEATDMTMVENNALLVQRYGNLWDRLRVNFRMNANVYDPRIEAQKSWFISRQDYLNRLTARASRYLYYTVREAERRNIPTELALLPVIESSYDPNANSNAAAAGLWQFIPSTGRIYGLNQTTTFDGRRDVIESTRAAYDFLTALYNQFGSWELALAAYNAGPGRVQSAINYNAARGLPTDYWSLKLPTETMNYVPRFLAVAQIVKNPSNYNVYLPAIANRQHFRSVPANVGVSLYEVSSLTGVGYDELRALNPALIAGSVDMSGPSRILIPNDLNESVDRKISQLRGNGYMSQQGYLANNSYVTPKTTQPSYNTNPSNNPAPTTRNNGDSLAATQQAYIKKENVTLPSSSSDLAAMATSMVKNQTTTYIAPMPSIPSVQTNNTVIKEPPITATEQKMVTAEMQSTNTLPTTSAVVTANNTIVQEPPLSTQERNSIAKEIEKTAPQVEQAINPSDGNIKLNAIQTQQSVLEAKGETKKLSYEEPPVVLPKDVKIVPTSTVDTKATTTSIQTSSKPIAAPISQTKPATVVINKPVAKKRPTGTRTTYQVKAGDTLANIASRMGVSWRDIAEWNQIDPNAALLAGSTLYIYNAKPIEPKVAEVPKRKANSYIVQAGDTLTGIAEKFDLNVSELAKFNNLPMNYQVRTGQNLWLIPDKVPKTPVTQSAAKPSSVKSQVQPVSSRYTVQTGDTLSGIADRLSVSAKDIADVNGFSENYRVQKGQVINVPVTVEKVKYALAGKSITYSVRPGDSLGSVANNFNLSVAELAKANYLKPTANLLLNQKLVIPQAGLSTVSSVTATREPTVKREPTKQETPKKETKTVKDTKADDNIKSEVKPTTKYARADVQSYQVKSGDSLTNLSAKYGVSKSELAALNNLKGNESLLIGQTIKIPKTTTTYKVKAGEGLIALAGRFGVTPKELASMNNLAPTASLKVGQTITVPK